MNEAMAFYEDGEQAHLTMEGWKMVGLIPKDRPEDEHYGPEPPPSTIWLGARYQKRDHIDGGANVNAECVLRGVEKASIHTRRFRR